MSTRSRIGITNQDGTIVSIYCHCDGYPSHVGHLLKEYYNTPERIRDLIALGDIDVLDKRLNPDLGYRHTGNARQKGVTLAGHRDCGQPESETRPAWFTDRANYKKAGASSGEEWLYVFDGGYWYCYDVKEARGWMPVEQGAMLER